MLRKPFFRADAFTTQMCAVFLLSMFFAYVIPGIFFRKSSLCWDNLHLFSAFRDNLHSLNYFGHIQWWNPSAQLGFPAYYVSVLGVNCISPLFVCVGALIYLLGLIGIKIASYHILYVIYFGVLIPLLFNTSLLLVARQIFKKSSTIFFIIFLGTFSPGVIFNMTDNGIEHTAYSFFFAAAYLVFLRNQSRRNFWLVVLTALILAVSFNHPFLFWNTIFIPVFIVISNLFSQGGFIERTKEIFKSISLREWFIACILVIICLLPALTTAIQRKEINRVGLDSSTYPLKSLRAGNPLEVLSASTPGIGFEWMTDEKEEGKIFWTMTEFEKTSTKHLGYNYLGMLALPLSLVGFLFGQYTWRLRLFSLIMFFSSVILLSGFSPLFNLILNILSPLRAVNHYSDTVFRNGIAALLILSAALGFEAVLSDEKRCKNILIPVFAGGFLMSLIFFVSVYRDQTFNSTFFSFAAIMFVLYLLVLAWLVTAETANHKRVAIAFLLALTLIDVSTVSFLHMRKAIWPTVTRIKEPPMGTISICNDMRSVMNELFMLKNVASLYYGGFDFSVLPPIGLFGSATTDMGKIFDTESGVENKVLSSIMLPEEYEKKEEYRDFFERGAQFITSEKDIKVLKQDSNSLELQIISPHKVLFFWRDSYFPSWKATVNGKRMEIAKAFGAFKAIAVPPGVSIVKFRFFPISTALALFIAYVIITVISLLLLFNLSIGNKSRKEG